MSNSQPKFKVGDVVRAKFSGLGGYNLSEPMTIESIHAGNGNLKVNGTWWRPSGHLVTASTWDTTQLIFDDSDECREIIRIERCIRTKCAIRDAVDLLDTENGSVGQLQELLKKVKEVLASQKKAD